MVETVFAAGVLDDPISEPTIRAFPRSEYDGDDTATSAVTVRLAILFSFAIYIYRKVCQFLDSFHEKMNRKEVVPGFPSNPNPHWLVGHLMTLRGAEVQVVTKRKKKISKRFGDENKEATQVSTSFVRGYQRVYCDFADPDTGRGSFWFFHVPCVSLTRGTDARKVMRASNFRNSAWMINKHTRQFLGRKSLLVLMNKEWRYYRTAVHKSFTSEVVKQSRPFIYQIGNALTDSLLAKIAQPELLKELEDESISDDGSEDETLPSSSPPPSISDADIAASFPILPIMKMATIDIFGLVALRSNGVDFRCTRSLELSPIASAFDHLTTEYTVRLKRPWDPLSFLYSIPTKANRDYSRKRSMIRGFITTQIAKTRTRIAATTSTKHHEHEQCDLLTNLIRAADSQNANAQQQTANTDDEALGDILMTLLFAGYDTTSISLTYALYLLAKNPTKNTKCLAEIDAVFGTGKHFNESDGKKTDQSLPPGPEELPYTKGVILESLRLYPPAPSTARTIEKPTTIGACGEGHTRTRRNAHFFKPSTCPNNSSKPTTNKDNNDKVLTLTKGQMVMLPIWSIHRSELNYPRPNEMIPERWVRRKRKKQRSSNDQDTKSSDKSKTSLWEVRPEDDSRKENAVDCDATIIDYKNIEAENDDDENVSIPPANRDAFCAFAAGARNCVGKNLAVEESVILLACLVHRLSFELISESYEVSPCIHAVVQQPDDNLPMVVRPRR